MSKKGQRDRERGLPPNEKLRRIAQGLATGELRPGGLAEALGDLGWDVRLAESKDGFYLQAETLLKPGEEPRIPPS